MKKKYLKSAISIGVGVIVLTGAVFANYESANGYSSCKNALKTVAFAENFSMDYTMDITFDGGSYQKTFGSYKLAAGENPCLQTEVTEENEDYTYFSRRTIQDDINVYENHHSKGGDRQGFVQDKHSDPTSIAAEFANDEEIGEKIVFWLETLADALVGDLKNSFVLVSNEDGISKFNISLTKEQMPSYVTAGVSLLTTAIKNDNSIELAANSDLEDEPFYMMFGRDEPYVRDASANMSIDDDGNPVQVTGVVNIIGYDRTGKEHIMAFNLSIDFYDFGSTEIERVSDETIKSLDDYRHETVRSAIAEQAETAGEVVDTSSFPETGEATSVGVIGGVDGPTAIYVR